MPNIGPLELGIVLLIVLLIVGTARLPAVAKSLGSELREFKDALTGKRHGDGDDQQLEGPVARNRTDHGS
jgi:sec-independent protein translocase protein TatA